jgi:predicted transcriptional regulator
LNIKVEGAFTLVEVPLSPDKQLRLEQLAVNTGRTPAQILEDALDRVLDEDNRFREAVRKGIASLDRGEFIEEDEMHARIRAMLERE